MGTQQTVMESLSSASKIMGKVNEDMNIADIQKMMKEFQKEQMKAEMNQEMVGEAMDMGDMNEEADEVFDQILGEIGMKMEGEAIVGSGQIAGNKAAV